MSEEVKKYDQDQTALKSGAISKAEVTIMSICAAAPAMCMIAGVGAIAATGGGAGISLSALIATLAVVLIGLSYGKLSEKYNRCGGTWSYIQQAMGQRAGVWTAFVYFAVLITTSGCPAAIFGMYLQVLVPAIPLWVGWLICIIIVFSLTWRGIELSTKALIVVWVVQMALLIWPAIAVIGYTPNGFEVGQSFSNAFVPSIGVGFGAIGAAACVWIWSFVGFECPAYMGEELKGGSKAVKFAIPISGLCVGLIYVISMWLFTATMPAEYFTDYVVNGGDFMLDYVDALGYTAGVPLLAASAVVSCLACSLAFHSLMPRFLFDLSREGIMPKALSKVNKYQIPHNALFTYIVVGALASAYSFWGYNDGIFDGINDWFAIMGITASMAYGFICIANIKEGVKDKTAGAVIMRIIIPILTVALLLWIIGGNLFADGGVTKFFWVIVVWVVLAFIFMAVKGGKKA